MTAAMWWFFTIIVTNSYMANLAAFLTNERSQGSINSAEDLSKQTKVKYGTMEGGSTQGFFRESNYSTFERMWTQMEQARPSVFEKSNDLGVARVQNAKNRGYAFLMESATLEYQIYTKCDLIQVGGTLDSKSYGIAMPLGTVPPPNLLVSFYIKPLQIILTGVALMKLFYKWGSLDLSIKLKTSGGRKNGTNPFVRFVLLTI